MATVLSQRVLVQRSMMLAMTLFIYGLLPNVTLSAEPQPVKFDTYDGYFVSNKFEPDTPESYVLLTDQKAFNNTFGVAFVMGDKSHRLAKDVFTGHVVVAVVKRGMAITEFKVNQISESADGLEIRYTTKEQKQNSAQFASPLIISVPRKDYQSIRFVENEKLVKTIKPGSTNP